MRRMGMYRYDIRLIHLACSTTECAQIPEPVVWEYICTIPEGTVVGRTRFWDQNLVPHEDGQLATSDDLWLDSLQHYLDYCSDLTIRTSVSHHSDTACNAI
jgi:hypothetical protein